MTVTERASTEAHTCPRGQSLPTGSVLGTAPRLED